MKKLFKVLLVVIIPVVFYLATGFFSSGKENNGTGNVPLITQNNPPPNPQKDFMNIIFNFHYNSNSTVPWVENQFLNLQSLKFNTLQIYGGFNQWDLNNLNDMGSDRYGTFGTDLRGDQIINTNDLMDNMQNAGFKGIFGRIKIEALCYGQRLIYEAEGGNNGFSYGYRMNPSTQDGDRWVVKAIANGGSGDVILCENITENLQHSDIIDYTFNSVGTWYIKPVMKIRQQDFSYNDDREVVKIEIRNFSGNILDTKIIRVRNFADQNFNYYGQYMDLGLYNFFYDPDMNLQISGSTNNGLNHGRAPSYQTPDAFKNACHVDFKIIWCGNVDVWFDKLIVDDGLGNDLFEGLHDSKIADELNPSHGYSNHPANVSYYADEVKYSNFECIKYVKNKMQAINPNAELVCIANPAFQNLGLRDTSDIFGYFLNLTNLRIRSISPICFGITNHTINYVQPI